MKYGIQVSKGHAIGLQTTKPIKVDGLTCSKCKGRYFTYHGSAIIGGVRFNGYVCVKCKHEIANQVI